MSLHVTLRTTGIMPTADTLQRWLTERGEPFEVDGDTLHLRALPVKLALAEQEEMSARLDVRRSTAVLRLVDLLFDLSVVAGADVDVAGVTLTRPALWLLLASEQDRLRMAAALDQASERGIRDEVLRRLWAVLNALRPGQDVRWSADRRRIVQMREVGAPGGLSVEEAGDAELGDLVPVPLSDGTPHLLAWRWLSEAYPSLTEA